jgi:hypothetical protein
VASNGRLTVNDELGNVKKEEFKAYFNVLS